MIITPGNHRRQSTMRLCLHVCVLGCGVLGIDKRVHRSCRFRERLWRGGYTDSLILCIKILHLEAKDMGN